MAVTAAGKVFQKYAEETIEQRRVMLIALAEMHRIPRGEIVVSANEGTCLHILPEVFAEFKRQYPDVAVNVKRSEHQKILEAHHRELLRFWRGVDANQGQALYGRADPS